VNSVAWTRQSVRSGDQTAGTGRVQLDSFLAIHAGPYQQQAVGRLVAHRKRAGRSSLQMATQALRSPSVLCHQRLGGRLQPLREHDGQNGRRNRRKQPRAESGSHPIHNGRPRQMSRGGLPCSMGEEIKAVLGTDPRSRNLNQAAQASGACAAAFWLR
jgi:hypothetical protein